MAETLLYKARHKAILWVDAARKVVLAQEVPPIKQNMAEEVVGPDMVGLLLAPVVVVLYLEQAAAVVARMRAAPVVLVVLGVSTLAQAL